MKKCTLIIPFYGTYESISTVIEKKADLYKRNWKKDIEVVFVNQSIEEATNKKIELLCERIGWKYVHEYTSDRQFSLARARNVGILNSETEYIMMDDIDIVYGETFFSELVKKIDLIGQKLPNFLTIPVAYLDKDKTEQLYLSKTIDSVISEIRTDVWSNVASNIPGVENFVACSALIVMRRITALFNGLYDESIKGWGGEDRDFIFRLLSIDNVTVKPSDFGYTSKEPVQTMRQFVGWRSMWVAIGDYMFAEGFLALHSFHEKREWRNLKQSLSNFNFVKNKAKLFSRNRLQYINPYDDKRTDTFIIGRNPYLLDERMYDYCGGYSLIEQNLPEDEIKAILSRGISNGKRRLLIWNPFGNSKMRNLFNHAKAIGYNIVVAERGALPNSYIFDHTLSVYSNSYAPEKWINRSLSVDDRKYINEYISNVVDGDQALEKMPERNLDWLRIKYNTKAYTNIVFIGFQLEDDTVTNTNLDGELKYEEFISLIKEFGENKPEGTLILYKNHPLSNLKYQIPNAVCVDDIHINDAIALSNVVVTYNSGVGILSLLFSKPTVVCGPAFYCCAGLNQKTKDLEGLLRLTNVKFLPNVDDELKLKFVHYLVNDLYSFARVFEFKSKKLEKSTRTYAQRVVYWSLKFPGAGRKTYDDVSSIDLLQSRFGLRFTLVNDKKTIEQSKSKVGLVQKNCSDARKTVVSNDKRPQQNTHIQRKLKKLFSNPYAYFNDSKKWIRVFRVLFKK